MRQAVLSTRFKKDLKRLSRQRRPLAELDKIMTLLLNDEPIPEMYKDHMLIGNWMGYRELHISPDLLLIYKKTGNFLRLAAVGSYSEIF
ncbi:MAG: type II toxin-antitoxin system YafQ family toxin [Synergistes sp.]|nr:type II toxin-antitoxin system YafQ family toxin [Synergistes sp.]